MVVSLGSFSTGAHTAAGGPPTPALYGTNVESLSADKVLTDSDETIQALSLSGTVSVDVILPPTNVNNPLFIINNVDTSGSINVVIPGVSGQKTVLGPGFSTRCYSTGAAWVIQYVAKNEVSYAGQQYTFGKDSGSTMSVGQYLFPNVSDGDTTVAHNGTRDANNQITVAAGGNLSSIWWNTVGGGGDQRWTLWIDGVKSIDLPIVGTSGWVEINPLFLTLGSRITIEMDFGSSPTSIQIGLFVQSTEGYLLQFGGNLSNANYYTYSNAPAAQALGSTLNILTEHSIHEPVGTSAEWDRLSYFCANASATTVLNVFLNGAFAVAFNLSGGSTQDGDWQGYQGIAGGSLSTGDTFAVRFVSGTTPGNSIISILISVPGVMYSFSGGPSGVEFLQPWAKKQNVLNNSGLQTKAIITQRAAEANLVWERNSFGNTAVSHVFRNDILVAIITMGTGIASGSFTWTSQKPWEPGDTISVKLISGTTGSLTHNIVLI